METGAFAFQFVPLPPGIGSCRIRRSQDRKCPTAPVFSFADPHWPDSLLDGSN